MITANKHHCIVCGQINLFSLCCTQVKFQLNHLWDILIMRHVDDIPKWCNYIREGCDEVFFSIAAYLTVWDRHSSTFFYIFFFKWWQWFPWVLFIYFFFFLTETWESSLPCQAQCPGGLRQPLTTIFTWQKCLHTIG